MKEIIKLAAIMAVFAILSALLLSYTYSKTKPIIEKNKEAEKGDTLFKKLMPDASGFKSVQSGAVNYVEGFGKDGELQGYILEGKAKGYGGDIEYYLSVNKELMLLSVKIISHKETPGLGSKIESEEFLGQLRNLKKNQLFLKKDAQEGAVDAITAATISSRAVVNSVRTQIEAFSTALSSSNEEIPAKAREKKKE